MFRGASWPKAASGVAPAAATNAPRMLENRPKTQGKRPKNPKTPRHSGTLPRPSGFLYQRPYRTSNRIEAARCKFRTPGGGRHRPPNPPIRNEHAGPSRTSGAYSPQLYLRTLFIFFLSPLPPGGVRPVMFLRRSMILGRFRIGPGGK